MKQTLLKLNLSVALADVINTLMMEFEAESRMIGKELKHESRQRFNHLKASATNLRRASKLVASDGYAIKNTDGFCEDSDYLRDLLLLIADRTGESSDAMVKLRAMIYNMKSPT